VSEVPVEAPKLELSFAPCAKLSEVEVEAPQLELWFAPNAWLSETDSLALCEWVPVFEYAEESVVEWLKLETLLSVLAFVVLSVFA
jgi:hypothetical protein